ncbi:MAG TPA: aldehyde dehydrogenase family protein, partial [Magnetovibrio sp.]
MLNTLEKSAMQADHAAVEETLCDYLKNTGLLAERAYLDGEWISAANGATMTVHNPSDDTHLGDVPDLDVAMVTQSVDAAATAFKAWSKTLPQERARKIRLWGELMLAEREDLALIMTLEQGKPLKEALGEIDYAAGFLDWYA